ncbi:M28 family metallopeptidase [Amycolatopsis nalaikhensis]|uniref:M28 family peptidase n=1 Tax=Amycolatopsis nalaikhensis TaxID=715472 RepID=A0ABY8XFP1_9PSEU|nr:M28 family peptidase [Amycolatopsis sp. 2-2]WIV54428.1 M28 family peptidase [Amycolatopsis sp. 2-2]
MRQHARLDVLRHNGSRRRSRFLLRPGGEGGGCGSGFRLLRMTSRLRHTVTELAADRFTGRRVGTAGGRAAAAWLGEQLRAIGATVTTDEFPVVVRELYRTPSLRLGERELVHRRDFAEHLASADLPAPRTGELVTATADRLGGRWVLAPDLGVSARATRDGAAGLLVPRGTDEAGWMPKMITGPPSGELPVLAVRAELHRRLTTGESVTASTPLRAVEVVGSNVHGRLREPGEVDVLLTAHFDGVGDDPGQRLPAAADNASGVAVVLEAARQLTGSLPGGIGLAVAFLDAEEAGARGSAHHAPTVPSGTVVLNVDGAARLGEAAAVEAGGPAHALLAALDQAGRTTGVPLRAGAMPSDNRRYAAAGLAAAGIGMGMPGYQTPAETPDRVETETLAAATRLVVAAVQELARRARG